MAFAVAKQSIDTGSKVIFITCLFFFLFFFLFLFLFFFLFISKKGTTWECSAIGKNSNWTLICIICSLIWLDFRDKRIFVFLFVVNSHIQETVG
jgi:hypothetical protein